MWSGVVTVIDNLHLPDNTCQWQSPELGGKFSRRHTVIFGGKPPSDLWLVSTFNTLHSSQPVYLYSALHAHHSTSSLRLSNTNLLSVEFVRTSFGARSFSVTAPKIWNSQILETENVAIAEITLNINSGHRYWGHRYWCYLTGTHHFLLVIWSNHVYPPPYHNHFIAVFPGPPGWANASIKKNHSVTLYSSNHKVKHPVTSDTSLKWQGRPAQNNEYLAAELR